jgi:DNA-binding IclR family transcriptional regulator
MSTEAQLNRGWRFVTNHTQVLLCIARNPDVRLRDVAAHVGITERAAQRILADLVEAGFVDRERVGRRNRYSINRKIQMRHPAQFGHEVGELLDLLALPDVPKGAKRHGRSRRSAASWD